jgi:hypothetical protein
MKFRISAFVVTVLAAALLAACGKKEEAAAPAETAAPTNLAEAPGTTTQFDENAAPEPKADQPQQ